jgi:trk system potassium uptake protein TrkH
MSILLCLLAVMMLIPAAFDFAVDNPDWQVFVVSALVVFFAGAIGYAGSRKSDENPSRREIFIFVSVIWLLYCAAATLPFMLSTLRLSFTDAFFETASGFTTTGSTVLSGLDSMPPGIRGR